VNDNVIRDANGVNIGYARWHVYPDSSTTLRNLIEDAYHAPSTRPHLIDNTRTRRLINSSCS
jgi:hypothetical protein